jgi:hypothetical protein
MTVVTLPVALEAIIDKWGGELNQLGALGFGGSGPPFPDEIMKTVIENVEATAEELGVTRLGLAAEQALLGSILVDNAAFDDVGVFLAPRSFAYSIHQKIYEIVASLILGGKVATPIALKTFLPANFNIDGLRLAAEAISVNRANSLDSDIYNGTASRSFIARGIGSAFGMPS